MRHLLVPLCVAGTFGMSSAAFAQSEPQNAPEAEAPMQTVVVRQIKDPDMMAYSYVFEKMQDFEKLKEKDKIFLRFFAVPIGDAQLSKLRLTLEGPERSEELKVEPDGTIEFPFSEQAYATKAEVMTNQKLGAFKVHYGPGIKVPASTTFKYRDVMDGVKQSTTMMKKFWNFLFPSFKGASLRYATAEGQYAIIQSAQGERRIEINPDKKSIAIELDSSLYEENPTVTVSQKPDKISPFNVKPKA